MGLKNHKKGQVNLSNLAPIAITFVVIAIMIAVGAIVVDQLGDDINDDDGNLNSTAFNVTQEGLSSLTNLSEQLPLLATVIIFSVIIAVVVGFFAFRRGGGGVGRGV